VAVPDGGAQRWGLAGAERIIDGIWDLQMVGAGRADMEARWQRMRGLPRRPVDGRTGATVTRDSVECSFSWRTRPTGRDAAERSVVPSRRNDARFANDSVSGATRVDGRRGSIAARGDKCLDARRCPTGNARTRHPADHHRRHGRGTRAGQNRASKGCRQHRANDRTGGHSSGCSNHRRSPKPHTSSVGAEGSWMTEP
jgi:hypothetical protein